MKKTPLLLTISLTLLLAACSQDRSTANNTSKTDSQPLVTTKAQATAQECAIFKNNGLVATRVDINTEQDFYDIAKTFEPIGGSPQEGYILLDVGKEDFERLRMTASMRDWKVTIDEAATKKFNSPELNAQSISGFSCYRTVEETYQAAEKMARDYPNLASWKTIGPTWLKSQGAGGYDMKALVITNKQNTGNKPKLLITSAIHAREYTTAELATRFAEYLVSNYGKDPDVTWMLDSQEVHLILQANPDGRKEAETGKMQRKNVNKSNGACSYNEVYGIDLNRNFGFFWGTGGSSTDPCSDTYRGPDAVSEIETQNLQRYIKSVFADKRGPASNDAAPLDTAGVYIDIHSYSELVLWPWGYTRDAAPNAKGLSSLGRKLAYFNKYKPQQAVGLYPTSGTTDDFVYGELGVAAYTFELGKQFFENCRSFNNTILPDNLASLLYALRVARAPYIMGGAPDVVNLSATQNSDNSFSLTARADAMRFQDINSQDLSSIAGAEYYIDTPPWQGGVATSISAQDGRFNSNTENLTASLSIPSGRHTIYVRAKNSLGNFGPISAIFVDSRGNADNPNNPDKPDKPVTPPTNDYSFSIKRGESKYFPTAGFEVTGGSIIKGQLTGTDRADLDLYLEKLRGNSWYRVTQSVSYNNSNESIRYRVPSASGSGVGTYRWKVRAWFGDATGKLSYQLD